MRPFIGASGASFEQAGQRLTKRCHNAIEQATWLRMASVLPLVDGVRCVEVYAVDANSYTMEHITGHLATVEPSTQVTRALFAQIGKWRGIRPANNATWDSYLDRLQEHCDDANSEILRTALNIITLSEPFPESFNHGDITYENVLIQPDNAYCLIDPNYSPGLYQSFILDFGKMLQSTHTRYHALFNTNTGINLGMHDELLCGLLREAGHYHQALLACLTHIIRLAKYRRDEINKVETLAQELLGELKCLS